MSARAATAAVSARRMRWPSGIGVTKGRLQSRSRSLAENKLWALRRLRIKLATDLREPIDLLHFEPPDWFLSIRHDTRIEANHRHPYYAPAAGLILDLLQALAGNPAAVATNLGVSTTAVLKLLSADPHFWTAANVIRKSFALPPLTPRR